MNNQNFSLFEQFEKDFVQIIGQKEDCKELAERAADIIKDTINLAYDYISSGYGLNKNGKSRKEYLDEIYINQRRFIELLASIEKKVDSDYYRAIALILARVLITALKSIA